jgi:aspartyl-tRNA(Asn)/glutamyl-tRNA(Gln) amidotransferase subunit A
MDEQEICYLDIVSLGKLYRERIISPVEATHAALNRIRRFDDQLNSFITVLEESALERARLEEQELGRGNDRGPLQGVPVSLKDLFDTAGVRTTAASRVWQDRVPDQTATTAQRLMDAGAILIGKCNLLEFAYGIVHPDYGQCNNPWDITRTSGGSSSGSTASVAAGMCWGSLGTDTGGSIRVPVSYCGVVGLKATYGRVSRHGVFPLSWSLDHVGPITRTVEDTAIILQVIAGHDPLDSTSATDPVPDYRAALTGDVSGLTVGVLEQHMGDDLHPGVAEVTREAIAELERAGMRVQSVEIPSLPEADPAMLVAILPEATVVHQEWLRDRPEDYAEMTRQQLELGALIPAVDYVRVQQYRRRLLAEFLEAFQQVDVLVNPTVAFEAPEEDPEVAAGQGSAEARRTGPYNLVGLPVISVPCGFGRDGLPLGLQIAGPPMGEELVLRVAHAYEQRAGWYQQRPSLE